VRVPSGTMTLLFTDIEGSTRLWEEHRASTSEALQRHDNILREVIAATGGIIFATGGDGFSAAFQRVPHALEAALRSQVNLSKENWDPPLQVRMAIHTGEVEQRGDDHFGPPLNRCPRLMATAQAPCTQDARGGDRATVTAR
jgi:class 3 adenylate cyclase